MKIAIAVHSYGHICPKVYANHIGVFSAWAKMFSIILMHLDGVKTAEARNVLVDRAIEEGCTHIFFLDSDHIVDKNMLSFLAGNKDATVVSGLVVKRDGKNCQVGFIRRDDGMYHTVSLPTDGLSFAVDACAFGCTLIDLSIFKELEKPYFRDEMIIDAAGEIRQRRSDIGFCDDVKKLGKDIRIDTRAMVGHVGDSPVFYPESKQFQEETYKVAVEILKSKVNSSAIDLGCGFGSKLVSMIEPLCDKVVGIDLPVCINGARKIHPDSNVIFECGNLDEDIDIPGKFDVIICADVLEHLSKPEIAIANIIKHLKLDGLAVISTPDNDTVKEETITHPEHLNFWNEKEFVSLLESNGLEVMEIKKEKEIVDYISMIAVCKLRS